MFGANITKKKFDTLRMILLDIIDLVLTLTVNFMWENKYFVPWKNVGAAFCIWFTILDLPFWTLEFWIKICNYRPPRTLEYQVSSKFKYLGILVSHIGSAILNFAITTLFYFLYYYIDDMCYQLEQLHTKNILFTQCIMHTWIKKHWNT